VSELLAFGTLGFRHITDPRGADHILFLLALAAIYRFGLARVHLVVTAFTVGHSVTLALAVTGALVLPSGVIEFLIPVTIVATALENLIVRDRSAALWGRRYRPVFAGVFGLVHGAGFANYLRSLFVDRIAIPLLGFNLGLEAGQLIVIALAFISFAALDRAISLVMAASHRQEVAGPLRIRTLAVSVLDEARRAVDAGALPVVACRRRLIVSAAVIVCGIAGSATVAFSHPLHTTLTEITTLPDGSVQIVLRAFIDDFSAAVTRRATPQGTAIPTPADSAAARYLGQTVVLTDAGGRRVPLQVAAMRRTDDLVWITLRAPTLRSVAGARLTNRVLFERWDDQVNIVQTAIGARRQTLLFTNEIRYPKAIWGGIPSARDPSSKRPSTGMSRSRAPDDNGCLTPS
jgi:hypothetical protein